MNIHNQQKAQQTRQLTNAFHLFNELSQNLTESYQSQQEQVVSLRRELTAARNEGMQTLLEKEKITRRMQRVLAALPAGVVLLDEDARVVDVNTVASKLLEGPLLGELWVDVMRDKFIPEYDNPQERQLRDGRHVSINSSPLHDEPGQIVLLSDVSEMRDMQAFVQRQKHLSAMGEMLASMAHQVRTPLSTVVLYTSHLQSRSLSVLQQKRFAGKILERLKHLQRQVDDMLIFAREGKMLMENFSLKRMLEQLGETMLDTVGSRNIAFQIDNQAADDVMLGNENALRGALMNLLENAVQAVADNGRIVLTVTQPERRRLQFSVADDGPGIEAEHLQRIFEPFFTTRSNGTGLGLAVVDSVISAHGGELHCVSRRPQGAVFHFTLPCPGPGNDTLPGGFSGSRYKQEGQS